MGEVMRMRLVLKGPERLAADLREKSVETGSLVIGRSADADWVLSDPARIVSKHHCRIERQAGGFFLTDMSTNGVLINSVPLERESAKMLVDGDVLTLGDAIVAVTIEADAASAGPQDGEAVQPAGEDDPFTDGPFAFDEAIADATMAMSREEDEPPSAEGRIAVLQDWWIPEAGTGGHAAAKPVDISGGVAHAPIGHTNGSGETVALPDGGGANLVAEAEGLDVATFAGAVETAVLELSTGERHRFEERLRGLLRKRRAG